MYHPVLLLTSMLLIIVDLCVADYQIPEVVLEAYSPKGFRAYIPDTPGIRLFTFNGKLNGIIVDAEPGQINGEAKSPTSGVWEFVDPELQLTIGDKISYWVFVQHGRLGYRKDGLSWEVTKFTEKAGGGDPTPKICSFSASKVPQRDKVCSQDIILQDDFDRAVIDEDKWTIEQYIPTYFEEPYEFVSYQNIDRCRFIKDSYLYLKPVVNELPSLRGVLDLRNGCTKTSDDACYHRAIASQLNPPIISAKITSKITFKYGRIDIRAKMPSGDWIFPQLELIPKSSNSVYTKLLIAYVRGNARLVKDLKDIGSRMLAGGPVVNATEPAKSTYLKTKIEFFPLSKDFHTYSAIWTPDKIDLMLDNETYGSVPTTSSNIAAFNSEEFRLSLGVGVAGVRDFPEDYSSSGFPKPWFNFDPKAIKNFFDGRNVWLQTWQADEVALQIDKVVITAL